MKVSEVMTPDVLVARPDQTIRQVAEIMAEIDAGVLPVADHGRLVGMVTDRDIAIRGVAKGCVPDTPVSEVMTPEVKYCFEDEDIADVARNMADIQVRRLPVMNREKRLVGIIAIADLATSDDVEVVGETVCGISEFDTSTARP
jgi:CBS domain-containing protein